MVPKTKKQWIAFALLIVIACAILYLFNLEDNHPAKTLLRSCIRAIIKAI